MVWSIEMNHLLYTNELRALIQGKFEFRTCLECGGKGRVLVDGVEGIVVQAPTMNDDRYYEDICDECEGLGGFLRFL
jgi:hypothetical protein